MASADVDSWTEIPPKRGTAKTVTHNMAYSKMNSVGLPLAKGSRLEGEQPKADLQDVSQTASNKFQMFACNTDSDSDELSMSDWSLQPTSRPREPPKIRSVKLKLQRFITKTRAWAQCTQHEKVISGEAPTWIKKRSSLGFKRESRAMEDELG